MLPWDIEAKSISLHLMLTSLPFLSKWYFLGTVEDTRAMLFSCWLDLGNDEILSAVDWGRFLFRLFVPQWIMIRSCLGYIHDTRSSVFAPGKDVKTSKSSWIDNSQPFVTECYVQGGAEIQAAYPNDLYLLTILLQF